MCSLSSENLIAEVVGNFTSSNMMFTAFEISLAVQNLAQQRNLLVERHRDLKDVIHSNLESHLNAGSYQKILRDVGSNRPAFVYYPAGLDYNNYIPLQRNQSGTNVAQSGQSSVQSGTNVAQSGQINPNGKTPDARGTICVPNHLIKAVGFNKRQRAYVYPSVEDGKRVLVVCMEMPADKTALTTYTVDDYFNIRVTKTQLESAGISGLLYEFERKNFQIIIKNCV